MTSALRRALALLPLLAAPLLVPSCGGAGGAKTDFPPGSPAFHTDYERALAEARAHDKPVVLVFSASWCPPCRANKADVYPSPEVQALHGDFVWAYLDTDEARNRPHAGRYGVSGIPHIQFVDSSGAPLGEVVGGTTPADFARELLGAARRFRG